MNPKALKAELKVRWAAAAALLNQITFPRACVHALVGPTHAWDGMAQRACLPPCLLLLVSGTRSFCDWQQEGAVRTTDGIGAVTETTRENETLTFIRARVARLH